MRLCAGCGGVLGRDCFNEFECVEIGRRMNAADHIDGVVAIIKERQQLILDETNVDVKDAMIKELLKGIDPDYGNEITETVTSYAIDDLPF